jgi:hypothetical protein
LRPHLRTSFHHQPEAQHPKYSAIHNNAGRLPHLLTQSEHSVLRIVATQNDGRTHFAGWSPLSSGCLVHKEGLLHLLFTLAWIEIRERQANE